MVDHIISYFLKRDALEVLYVPHNVVVVSNNGFYNVKTKPSEFRLFADYWAERKVCLFEDGLMNSIDPLDYYMKIPVSSIDVRIFSGLCFKGFFSSAEREAVRIFENTSRFANRSIVKKQNRVF